MKSPYKKYPNLNAMSVSARTSALESTCLVALSGGLHPERMIDLVESTLENEEYELPKPS